MRHPLLLGVLAMTSLASAFYLLRSSGVDAAQMVSQTSKVSTVESEGSEVSPDELALDGAAQVEVPWEAIAEDAYDTLVGSGFDLAGFTNQWGGFDESGHYRPDFDPLAQAAIGRALSEDESAVLAALVDLHEESIRQAALHAHSTLREALDSSWRAGEFDRRRARTAVETEAEARATAEKRHGGGFVYADTFTTGGWEISMVIRSHDHPRFHDAFRELWRAVSARDADLAREVATLAG
ncbi:hypothetical protein Poly30_47030 [Planctomycetes bacterium Poly30]|uniref:Uncharacterized protein n=1 Tax=Saltatorellus ferox TaxID=2528018 RepID=A0A518EYH8_9BACT|nr:hypothetical protein Poly30_47030 [Planctomycetes bacterium Poly30]